MKKLIRDIIYKILGVNLINLKKNLTGLNIQLEMNTHLSKGALGASSRLISETNPNTWEFSAFSQNGEDGIIDYLSKKILSPNKYFIEVGASNGVECNSAYLSIVSNYSGLMIDGDPKQIDIAKTIKHSLGVEYHATFFDLQNLDQLTNWSLYTNPDVFSWDTDGNDYFFVKELFRIGFRPKIFVVEYNSAFGPHNPVSVVYDPLFNIQTAHSSQLYYGCSITLWRQLFTKHHYAFVAVDSNGVNAIFADTTQFEPSFLNTLSGYSFAENFYQLRKFRTTWEKQFELIKDMPYYTE